MTDRLPADPFGRVAKTAAGRQRSNPSGAWRDGTVMQAVQPSTADLLHELIVTNRALQRQIEALPAQIAAALQMTKPAGSLTDDECRTLSEIFGAAFPAMSAGCPRRASAADLVAHVRSRAPTTTAAAVLKLDDPAVDHAKRLGWLLKKADGAVLGGYFLQADGKQHNTSIWRISRV